MQLVSWVLSSKRPTFCKKPCRAMATAEFWPRACYNCAECSRTKHHYNHVELRTSFSTGGRVGRKEKPVEWGQYVWSRPEGQAGHPAPSTQALGRLPMHLLLMESAATLIALLVLSFGGTWARSSRAHHKTPSLRPTQACGPIQASPLPQSAH